MADVNTPSIDDQTASHQPPRSVSPETDTQPTQPTRWFDNQPQPHRKDPRFKDETLHFFNERTYELYLKAVTECPDDLLAQMSVVSMLPLIREFLYCLIVLIEIK